MLRPSRYPDSISVRRSRDSGDATSESDYGQQPRVGDWKILAAQATRPQHRDRCHCGNPGRRRDPVFVEDDVPQEIHQENQHRAQADELFGRAELVDGSADGRGYVRLFLLGYVRGPPSCVPVPSFESTSAPPYLEAQLINHPTNAQAFLWAEGTIAADQALPGQYHAFDHAGDR